MYNRIALAVILVALHSPARAGVIRQYELNGSFADTLGGPDLIPNGGTLNAFSYDFGPNQGLSLSNALPANDHYSIRIDFSFTQVSGYRKIIDFSNLESDDGLYILDQNLDFYPEAAGSQKPFASNVLSQVVLTRDRATEVVAAYVNGVPVFTFIDSRKSAVFSGANDIIQFFKDDATTGFSEASAGSVNRIVIYDTPLSASEVAGMVGSDADGNGLADLWEIEHFGATNQNPTALAANGETLLDNFISGTDPNSGTDFFQVFATVNANQRQISFIARAASGPGYSGLTRYYILETTADLKSGPWVIVPGYANIPGNNQTVTFSQPLAGPNVFYRGSARLLAN